MNTTLQPRQSTVHPRRLSITLTLLICLVAAALQSPTLHADEKDNDPGPISTQTTNRWRLLAFYVTDFKSFPLDKAQPKIEKGELTAKNPFEGGVFAHLVYRAATVKGDFELTVEAKGDMRLGIQSAEKALQALYISTNKDKWTKYRIERKADKLTFTVNGKETKYSGSYGARLMDGWFYIGLRAGKSGSVRNLNFIKK